MLQKFMATNNLDGFVDVLMLIAASGYPCLPLSMFPDCKPSYINVTGIPSPDSDHWIVDAFHRPRDIYYFKNQRLDEWLTVFHIKHSIHTAVCHVEFRRGRFELPNPHLYQLDICNTV